MSHWNEKPSNVRTLLSYSFPPFLGAARGKKPRNWFCVNPVMQWASELWTQQAPQSSWARKTGAAVTTRWAHPPRGSEMWPTPSPVPGLLLAPLQHPPAQRGLAPAAELGLHSSTRVQVFFRPGKNNPADVQCFHIVCWHHMRCLFSLYSSEPGARQAKLHEIQCLGCL